MFNRRMVPPVLLFFIALSLVAISNAFSQGVVVVSKFIQADLPIDDPNSKLWDDAFPLEIPLSSQVNFKPRIYNATVNSLKVKSLHNGKEIAFLLEWDDPTRNVKTFQSESFTDAAAIQHPVRLDEKLWFCMGMPEGIVNIWYWRADWQAALIKVTEYSKGGWDYYPYHDDDTFYSGRVDGNFFSSPRKDTSVEDLNSARMQTLTPQPKKEQNVKGFGVWNEGKWKVVFYRALISSDRNDAQFKLTAETQKLRPIAFVIWDGKNGEVGARKAVSTFYYLDVSTLSGSKGYTKVMAAVILTVVIEAALVMWFRYKKKAPMLTSKSLGGKGACGYDG